MLRARAGVILAAGAVNTPQVLMLSGIGPGAHLAAMGLPVLVDNANVGAHLSDHQGLNYTWRMTVPTLNQVLGSWWGKMRAGVEWAMMGRGPLSSSINQGAGSFAPHPTGRAPTCSFTCRPFPP